MEAATHALLVMMLEVAAPQCLLIVSVAKVQLIAYYHFTSVRKLRMFIVHK